ncbi:hypothetical protein [Azospirillum doebereinerae]
MANTDEHHLHLNGTEVKEVAAEMRVPPWLVRMALLFRPADHAALVALIAWAWGLPPP